MFWKRIVYFLKFLRSLMRVNCSLFVGMWKLTKLAQPTITIFGGSRLKQDDPHAQAICALSKKLASSGFSILTGGGPGIMEAANVGALGAKKENHGAPEHEHEKAVSVGIGLTQLGEGKNKAVEEFITMRYFFSRKWLLVRYASGFVVGPGGFGTLDELSEVLTLIQTHRMPKTPMVLIGTEYWQPLLEWIHTRARKHGLLAPEDAALLTVTDDIDIAFNTIHDQCADFSECGISAKPKE